jgi:hypothetical protein
MAVSKDEWNKIEALVASRIEASVKELRPSGWRNALQLLREWGLLGVNVSVILALVVFAATQFYQANARLGKEERFEGKTEEQLKQIRDSIADINARLSKLSLNFSASQPISQFKSTLPELRSNIATAQKQNVKLPSTVLGDLRSKLAGTKADAPDYWPVVADFITYRSVSSASWSIPTNLSNCRDTKARTATLNENFTLNGVPQKMAVDMNGFVNCRFTLDSAVDGEWFNRLITKPSVIFFDKCVIVYNGGPVVARLDLAYKEHVVDSVAVGQGTSRLTVSNSVAFDDCIFEISVENTPTEQAKGLTQRLLAQEPPKMSLPIV